MKLSPFLVLLFVFPTPAYALPTCNQPSPYERLSCSIGVFEEPYVVDFAPVPESKTRSFPCTVTAYYSPLTGQKRYEMGSYQAEIRMEGSGTHGASGIPVFDGMLAASKDFSFGTKITVPGFGTGTVQDRGGAIRKNRIDVWMGYGDEGRAKAMQWGKRSLTCEVDIQ